MSYHTLLSRFNLTFVKNVIENRVGMIRREIYYKLGNLSRWRSKKFDFLNRFLHSFSC